MATLRLKKCKGGDIYFVDFVDPDDIRRRLSTRTSDRKRAELFLKEIEVQLANGTYKNGDLTQKGMLLSEYTKKYLEFSKATKACATYFLDKHALERLKEFLGDVRLERIGEPEIEEYKVRRLNHVKPVSLNVELRHLKSAFETAVRWGHLEKNPFRGIKLCRLPNSDRPKFFTYDEVQTLLDSIPDGPFKVLIYFYLYTGCRRNEALDLRWDDLDLEAGTVTFCKTKSGKTRTVPFNGILSEKLRSLDRDTETPFPFEPDYVTHTFKDHVLASGIGNGNHLHLHSLRHTYASHLVMSGVDLLTVSKLLGHSSVRITEMYAHLQPNHLKLAVERLRFE